MSGNNKVAPKVGDKVALFGENGTVIKVMTINARDFCRVDWASGNTSDEWADHLIIVEPR